MPIATPRKYWFFLVFLMAGMLAGCAPKDDKIGSEVQARVAAAAPGITAAVKDGVVTLSGQVDSDNAKTQAERTARDVKGVKNVVNNLKVKSAPLATPDMAPAPVATPDKAPAPAFEADDAKIKNAVTANLEKVGVSGVDVQVQNGEVKLTGDIKRAQLQDAMKAANEAKPKKVVNEMTIK
ncbi:MAG: BON domain-containing protein [Burkholderiales bacterium]|nr:BON domain-containing protein [Burkholderiales bacterium]MDQ3196488.1 BON domain-containing protein [Pseudomonadota bacterium]